MYLLSSSHTVNVCSDLLANFVTTVSARRPKVPNRPLGATDSGGEQTNKYSHRNPVLTQFSSTSNVTDVLRCLLLSNLRGSSPQKTRNSMKYDASAQCALPRLPIRKKACHELPHNGAVLLWHRCLWRVPVSLCTSSDTAQSRAGGDSDITVPWLPVPAILLFSPLHTFLI